MNLQVNYGCMEPVLIKREKTDTESGELASWVF